MFKRLVLFTLFSLSLIFGIGGLHVTAQVDLDAAEEELREELRKLEEEQALVQKTLNAQRENSASIERDVNILENQIYQAELSIRQKNLEIGQLQDKITLKQNTVEELDEKMSRSLDALSELIRQTNDVDNTSLLEIVLGNDSLTEFFVDLDSYSNIQKQLEELFDQIREIKSETEQEKLALTEQQNKEVDIKKEIEGQKYVVATKKNEKDGLLAASRQTEATYESILAEKQRQAAQIRSALFNLRDSAGIPFGEALEYAQVASRATGVKASFILAILKQESDLGKNVGTCNRAGDPESKKWYNIMPGPNDGSWRDDQTIFKRITNQLGLDINTTPLSCPWGGGWGGAMGPSQFIPYTWQAYESRIASAVGVKLPSPWNPQHAVMATALYVKDLGAAAGGYTAEKTAALKYYAGSNWNKPQNAFYGNSVMVHKDAIQKQIDFLEEVE